MASQAFSQFVITDGTTVIDLLELGKYGFGIGIEAYQPGRPQLKDGGVWRDSPFVNGRQLAYSVKQNVNDAITLQFSYRSHNEIIQAQETLDLMIEKALAYWGTDWQDDPIYIKAQALGETNPRYALIYNMSFDGYQDPFHEPYALTGPPPYLANGIVLGIERSVWLENAPGTGTAISFFHEDHTDETTSGLHIGNYRNAGLTHIYRYTGSFGSNMLSSSLPYALFSGTIAVGSIVYFGAPTPFFGLSFDLSVAMSASAWTITWEYSTAGATWTELDITSTYSDFAGTGVQYIVWGHDDGSGVMEMSESIGAAWTTESVNSVDQYWVRARVSALTGSATAPTQQTRQPYATAVPYAKTDSDQIDGTIDALSRLNLEAARVLQANYVNSVLIGLRSVDRGSNFTAYINLKTANNPTGISVSDEGSTVYTDTYKSPCGYVIRWTAGASESLAARAIITFSNTIAGDFYGRFRLFVRLNYTDTTGASLLRYRINDAGGETVRTGRTVPLPATPSNYEFYLADLGYISLPTTSLVKQSESVAGFAIAIDAYTINTKIIDLIDVFLLPVDEWSATISGGDQVNTYPLFDVDSIVYPKQQLRALQRTANGSQIGRVMDVVANGEAILHVNAVQALWAIRKHGDAANLLYVDEVAGYRQQRYHNLRSA